MKIKIWRHQVKESGEENVMFVRRFGFEVVHCEDIEVLKILKSSFNCVQGQQPCACFNCVEWTTGSISQLMILCFLGTVVLAIILHYLNTVTTWSFFYSAITCTSEINFLLREPRGFGFVQYVDPSDAAEAKYHMDRQILLGRELTVVFAEENRKRPADMRARDRLRYKS